MDSQLPADLFAPIPVAAERCATPVVHYRRESYDAYVRRPPGPDGGSDEWDSFKLGRNGTRTPTCPMLALIVVIPAMLSTAVVLLNHLTVGELIVGVGTLALALITAMLGLVTVKQDKRRRDREVQGIARLVDGELEVIQSNVETAQKRQTWMIYDLAAPGAAWDRGGGVIAAALLKDEAVTLIDAVADLRRWEDVVRQEVIRQQVVGRQTDLEIGLNLADKDLFSRLVPKLTDSRRSLSRLAYP